MTLGGRDHSRSSMASKTVPWLIFLAFALAWTLFHAFTAPNWASTDVYIFRDAGCNCAAGEGLVARSVPHNQSVEPELFASYTPGAPLLFALPARLFGCKPYVDVFYNLFFATLSGGPAAVWLASRRSVRTGLAMVRGSHRRSTSHRITVDGRRSARTAGFLPSCGSPAYVA